MPSIRRLSAIQIPQEESNGADYHHQSPDKNLTHTLHPVTRRFLLKMGYRYWLLGDTLGLVTLRGAAKLF